MAGQKSQILAQLVLNQEVEHIYSVKPTEGSFQTTGFESLTIILKSLTQPLKNSQL